MISLRVKTLDSVDHPFEMDDEATVYDLKEKIREALGIEISQQRLIFCGRVLQDHIKLSECGVDGKVLHMVQRAPPSVAAREAIREARQRETDNIGFNQANFNSNPLITPLHLHHITPQQIRRFVTMAATAHGIEIEDQPGLNLSPTASRMSFLRKLIQEIRELIETIRDNESDEPPNYPPEDPPQPAGTIAEAFRDAGNAEVICQTTQTPLLYQIEPASGSTRESRGRCIRAMRPTYHTPTSDFGELVQELHDLDAEFAPFREMYITTLRIANDSTVQLSERDLQRRQLTAEMSAEVFHSFAHAYHIVSDIGILMTHGQSRLTSEALMRHPLPVQAHLSVIQSTVTRRPLDSGASTSGQSSSAGQAQPSAPPAQPRAPQAQRSAPPAGRHQPIVNINVQPDPFTYQVEIETRVPITVNPDNQTQTQNQNVNQDDSANRPQIMLDFENLVRGLTHQGIGGVEVVMSMEEMLPHTGVPIVPQVIDGAALQQMFGSQIYLAQVPLGGQPTADFLQNVVSSVIRQGIVPGMDSEMTEASASQNQDQANQSGADPAPEQTENSGQQDIQMSSQAETSEQALTTESQPSQSQAGLSEGQGVQESGNSGSQPTQQSSGGGQASSTATSGRPTNQTISINNLVYDRFLTCDSLHARRQLERRRDETARNGGPFLTDNSTSRVQNIVETLFERFNQHAINEETLVLAGMLWLRESTTFTRGRTLMQEELMVLRRRLQVHLREIMQGEYQEDTQEQLTDLLFNRYAGFIRRMPLITPLRPSIDVVESMRNVIVRFLNEAMIVMFMENHEVCSRRFRIVFPRMFYELCGVIAYFCYEGIEGLRRIYRTFIADLIQNIDEPVRDLLYSLSIEILNTAIIRIQTNKLHCSQFLVTRENVPSTSTNTSTAEDAVSMDVTDAGEPDSEPMQSSSLSIAESPELEADYNIHACSTPPVHEMTGMHAALVPTVITLLNPDLPQSPTVSSAPVAPIVQTFTTIPNAPTQQTPTVVQSGPIVPTVSIVPGSIRTVTSDDPIVPFSPIVSATSVIVSAPSSAMVSEPITVDSSSGSPVILSPYSPLSPEGGDDDGTSTHCCFHGTERASATASTSRATHDIEPEMGGDNASDTASTSRATHDFEPEMGGDNTSTPSTSSRPGPSHNIRHIVTSTPYSHHSQDSQHGSRGRRALRGSHAPSTSASPYNRAHDSLHGFRGRRTQRGYKPNQHNNPGSSSSPDESSNMRFVPPAQIAQHWGEDWVPTFTRDNIQQQNNSSEPHSDAYLSGMPPKKRRCVRQSRPPATLEALISDSLSQVAPQLSLTVELRSAFRRQLGDVFSTRAAASSDYDPNRFEAIERFLKQNRSNTQKSIKKTNNK